MLRKYLYSLVAFGLAFAILSVSLLKSSSVNYALAATNQLPSPMPTQIPEVEYVMTLPGKVLPGSILWPLKAVRDRIWYILTFSHLGKAELALFFSDKRLASGQSLFKSGNPELGISTVTKGEKYMEMACNEEEIARREGVDTSSFLAKLASSSLKHREIIEKDIMPVAPSETRPRLLLLESYSKEAFADARDTLASGGKEVPNNPFEGQN